MFRLKPNRFTELCGWYGMSALIVAYGLVSFDAITGNGLIYQLLNLTGGIGLIIVSLAKNVMQSVLLNVFWAAIGMIAIIKIVLA